MDLLASEAHGRKTPDQANVRMKQDAQCYEEDFSTRRQDVPLGLPRRRHSIHWVVPSPRGVAPRSSVSRRERKSGVTVDASETLTFPFHLTGQARVRGRHRTKHPSLFHRVTAQQEDSVDFILLPHDPERHQPRQASNSSIQFDCLALHIGR